MEIKKRDKMGRFVFINGNARYKNKQLNGKRKGEHVIIWEKFNDKEVPKGCVIHHVNKDKKDNRIENLICMTYKEHNQIHKHPAWNKGIKAPQISKSRLGHSVSNEQIQKQKLSFFLKFLDSNIKIWKLRDEGLTFEQIAKELNITKGQAVARWRGFCKIYLIPFKEVRI